MAYSSTSESKVLVMNGGSSSVRFALYSDQNPSVRLASGEMQRIGQPGTSLTISYADSEPVTSSFDARMSHRTAMDYILDELENHAGIDSITCVGHRIVHGMSHIQPERITPELISELRATAPYDSEHIPREIEIYETIRGRYPNFPQVACFDTAFHRSMPRVAKLLPIPLRFDHLGVQRYGFHGISYSFLMEELGRIEENKDQLGRVILAHLGNGASLAAVREGQSIDTSMGFTPAAGLVMSTRSGDLDPGLMCYLAKSSRMTVQKFNRMVNRESGLLGLSEISSDMRDLLDVQNEDIRAAEAIDLFCYQVKKWIGSFSAALGGLNTLVFAGGIGENAPSIREKVCDDLQFLGIQLSQSHNLASDPIISTPSSQVTVRVIHTDEELMIARSVARLLNTMPA